MLDTHAAIKELTKAGLTEDAAEAIVQVQLRTLHQGLVTKEDLLEFKVEVEKRFGEAEKSFSALEARMSRLSFLTWVILVIVLLTNPIAAKLIERLLGVTL